MDDSPQAHRGTRWQVKLLAVLVPLGLLAGADLGLRALDLLPPDDPLLFYVQSHEPDFSPFAERADGSVEIAPDWINPGNGLRRRVGRNPGRQFLIPGFRSTRFARHKPADVVRVFVLGGSTAFGLYVDRQETFAARLEQALAARLPGRRVEVINLGCAGWASARVANVLGAVLEFDPDLLIVYSGHNEMLEGHLDSKSALGLPARIRAALLTHSALFAWLNRAVTALLWSEEYAVRAERVAALRAGQIPTYEPRAVPEEERVPPDPAFFETAAAGYRENVRAIAARAAAAGVPVLFLLPVANLLSTPSISARGDGVGPELLESLRGAREAVAAGRPQRGLRLLDRAVALAPGHAQAHFLRATVLQVLGRRDEALAEYQRALDLDVRTHRITSQLEAAMIESVESAGARWIDLRPVFRTPLDARLSAALFVDHLHPTALGHERIAEAVLPAVLELLGIGNSAP